MHGRAILIALLVALPVIFVLQNTQVVEIHFLFWKLSMSRVLIILLLLVIGMLAGWLLHSLFSSRKAHRS
jgi:lipopolysaccharide assembly protein A